jgi:uncharacterized membrane protein
LLQLGALALPGVGPIVAVGVGALFGGLIGGATGRIAGNLLESRIDPSRYKLLTERLQTGHTALVLEILDPAKNLERLRRELAPYRAELVEREADTAVV